MAKLAKRIPCMCCKLYNVLLQTPFLNRKYTSHFLKLFEIDSTSKLFIVTLFCWKRVQPLNPFENSWGCVLHECRFDLELKKIHPEPKNIEKVYFGVDQ